MPCAHRCLATLPFPTVSFPQAEETKDPEQAAAEAAALAAHTTNAVVMLGLVATHSDEVPAVNAFAQVCSLLLAMCWAVSRVCVCVRVCLCGCAMVMTLTARCTCFRHEADRRWGAPGRG